MCVVFSCDLICVLLLLGSVFVFKQKTAYEMRISDWSSDVCSSDLPGESGYDDADARLLDDDGPQGRLKMSWHFHSARDFPTRDGTREHCDDLRRGCVAP